jgi:CRP-like cAMP-binding protein
VLIREGEIGTEAYLVERGRLDVRRRGATGDEVSIATLGPGDWVGEMSLLLDEARSATVVATSDAQLRRITRQSFARLLADDPERTQELLRQLAGRVREANARMAPRASRGAKGA